MFTKNDLKNGDVIKKRNGNIEILVLPLGTLVCDDGHFNDFGDIRDDLINKNGNCNDIVAVRRPTRVSHCRFSAFADEFGELVYDRERDTKPLYNGKVVCVDLAGCNADNYTVGKIYQFKDGRMTCDSGHTFGDGYDKFYTFEDWTRYSSSKWIEIKE